jgi:hypothetical protein
LISFQNPQRTTLSPFTLLYSHHKTTHPRLTELPDHHAIAHLSPSTELLNHHPITESLPLTVFPYHHHIPDFSHTTLFLSHHHTDDKTVVLLVDGSDPSTISPFKTSRFWSLTDIHVYSPFSHRYKSFKRALCSNPD